MERGHLHVQGPLVRVGQQGCQSSMHECGIRSMQVSSHVGPLRLLRPSSSPSCSGSSSGSSSSSSSSRRAAGFLRRLLRGSASALSGPSAACKGHSHHNHPPAPVTFLRKKDITAAQSPDRQHFAGLRGDQQRCSQPRFRRMSCMAGDMPPGVLAGRRWSPGGANMWSHLWHAPVASCASAAEI